MRSIYFSFLTILLCALLAAPLSAKDLPGHHSHNDIQNTVAQFLKANLQRSDNIEIKTKVSRLDPRFKLAKCEVPLTAFSASDVNAQPRFSVGIRCNSNKPWSLYLTVNVEKLASLYITASPLSRGEILNENNIQRVKRDINKLRRGFFSNKKELIGMITKRSIRTGTIISSHHLKPPLMIKKGDNVDIIANTRSITIRMTGKAVSNGIKGQRIRVKNNSSRKIIDAIVITPGLVKVRI